MQLILSDLKSGTAIPKAGKNPAFFIDFSCYFMILFT